MVERYDDDGWWWKPVPGYEGLYEACEDGRVRSLRRGRVMAPYNNGNGYRKVTLCKDGKRAKLFVHQVICLAFSGERPEGMQVLHKDGNRLNCKADNLEYDYPKENAADRQRHGTKLCGSAIGNSVLTESKVRLIWACKGECSIRDTANKFKVDFSSIWKIWNGKTWKHVTDRLSAEREAAQEG